MDLVVWEAKRQNKSSPISLTLAGPGLDRMLYGFGDTMEDAVASAFRTPYWRMRQPGLFGAMARLDEELRALTAKLFWINYGDLDDDVPF